MFHATTKQKKSAAKQQQHEQPFFDFQSENTSFFGDSSFFAPVQGKFDVAQREAAPEEEEMAQGKFDTAQREAAPEEEEMAQGKFDTAQREAAPEEEEMAQGKFDTAQREAAPEEEEMAQGKFAQLKCASCEHEEAQAKTGDTEATTQAKSDSPTGMSEGLRGKMENSFGTDFSDVNVHTNSLQAKDIGALAYTQGNDMHFAPGQFNPETQSGQELIGHELTHVVQQREGRVEPTTEVNGMPVNDNHGLESEADNLGAKAAAGEVVNQQKKEE